MRSRFALTLSAYLGYQNANIGITPISAMCKSGASCCLLLRFRVLQSATSVLQYLSYSRKCIATLKQCGLRQTVDRLDVHLALLRLPHDPLEKMNPERQNNATESRPRRSKRRRVQDSAAGPSKVPVPAPTREDASSTRASTGGQAEQVSEEIAEDDLCPICQLLLYRPIVTQCNHAMCESCMAHWADVSVTSQMTIVDVDEEPAAFNPVSGVEAKCPMCRTRTSATLNAARSQHLSSKYPITWQERQAEEQAGDNAAGGEGTIQTIIVYIGNRHQLVSDSSDANVHEWTFFVKPSRTDIIEEVQILLVSYGVHEGAVPMPLTHSQHPTFKPSRIIRTRAPYAIKRYGWGYFTIQAYVILKAG